MNEPGSFKQEFINAALRIIEREKGSRWVSLREIAKEAGCSHANAYSYVSGFQVLFWLVVDASMDCLARSSDERIALPRSGESLVEALVASQYEFAFDHEGLCRMLWFEPPRGEPPEGVRMKILKGASLFSAALARSMGVAESPRITEIAQMLHSFIHGQIAKLYSGRILEPRRYMEGSKAQAMRLFRILATMPELESYEGWIPKDR
jgi:AcrR family transcriptional regulator